MKLILTSDTHYGLDGKTHSKHHKFWNRVAETIETEDVKVLIWAGDLTCNTQHQLRRTIEQMREHVKIPVALVRGNHDWWDVATRKEKHSGGRHFAMLDAMHRDLFRKNGIYHLEDGPLIVEDVAILGWDGWYGNSAPPSNDERFMFKDVQGCPMHVFMSNRAWKKFDEVLEADLEKYRAAIAVTHFNPYITSVKWQMMCANLKFLDMIKDKFDVFCCGHNHQYRDDIEDGCRILNCGSDYNKPQFKLFEV